MNSIDKSCSETRTCTILAIGFAQWRGCDPRALAQSFRELGHALIEIDAEDYVPWRWNGFVTRVFRRLFLNALTGDYNRDVLKLAESAEFDFILVFKGMYLQAETLRVLRSYGKPIYNFYPDVSFVDSGDYIPSALCHYDCIFTTKSFHGKREIDEFQIKELMHVRHGFDPEVHRPLKLSAAQMERYGCDISFVGCWSADKERLISLIINSRRNYRVVVYGIGWKYASSAFRNALGNDLRPGVFGDELAIVYNASRVNLGLLSRATSDASLADQTTVRTFQIPASRSFMLHEDTPEVRTYFESGKEIVLFESESDLIVKLDMALGNDALRDAISLNGYERCISEPYDYSSAAETVMHYFENSHVLQST